MSRLITEWSTDDPELAKTLQIVANLPDHTPERLAAEAALHTFQAAELQREVGEILAERRTRKPYPSPARPTAEPMPIRHPRHGPPGAR